MPLGPRAMPPDPQTAPALSGRIISPVTKSFQDWLAQGRIAGARIPGLRRLLRDAQSPEQLCRLLMESDGEYSSFLIAERLFQAYDALDDSGKTQFFEVLRRDYDLDSDTLLEAARAYADTSERERLENLTRAAECRRQELCRRLNFAEAGTLRLVRMREDLLRLLPEHPALGKVDADFLHLFRSWFNRGFLGMRPIDWETQAAVLEKIIAYESVHEIRNWHELQRRLLPPDRHCYAFFHPAMADEPLVFVEVALTDRMPETIDSILAEQRTPCAPDEASHAIFYSISNCHRGLSGVSFGNFLIKQVATRLQQRFRNLKHFATISPVPGFRAWLGEQAATQKPIAELLERIEQNPAHAAQAPELPKLAAHYLVNEKNSRQRPLDPVARFHLKNGASLERIHPGADPSAQGLARSCSIMVNYLYDLDKVEENHERYVKESGVVSSSRVRKLLSG